MVQGLSLSLVLIQHAKWKLSTANGNIFKGSRGDCSRRERDRQAIRAAEGGEGVALDHNYQMEGRVDCLCDGLRRNRSKCIDFVKFYVWLCLMILKYILY